MTMTLNGIPALSVRIFTPCYGSWFADVDLDLAAARVLPSGAATLVIGTDITLVGTIDPRRSGTHGPNGRARVVGGAGWDKPVTPLHFHNDGGLTSAAVVSATAAEVQERAVVAAPSVIGADFVRTDGPASQIFEALGLSWFVDATGTTIVAPRAPVPMGTNVQIQDWHPDDQVAELTSSGLILPGTVLVGPNIGTATVRDVEQTFDASGTSARAWCTAATPSDVGGLLAGSLAAIAREAVGVTYLRAYRYRVVLENIDGRLVLQAVERANGVPDVLPLAYWPAVAGIEAKLTPGTIVVVQFLAGKPPIPIVTHVEVGAKALLISAGLGDSPVARATETLAAIAAIAAYAQAVGKLFPLLEPPGTALVAALGPIIPLLPSKLFFTE